MTATLWSMLDWLYCQTATNTRSISTTQYAVLHNCRHWLVAVQCVTMCWGPTWLWCQTLGRDKTPELEKTCPRLIQVIWISGPTRTLYPRPQALAGSWPLLLLIMGELYAGKVVIHPWQKSMAFDSLHNTMFSSSFFPALPSGDLGEAGRGRKGLLLMRTKRGMALAHCSAFAFAFVNGSALPLPCLCFSFASNHRLFRFFSFLG